MINLGTPHLNKVAGVLEVLANRVLVAFQISLKTYLVPLVKAGNEKHAETIYATM